MMDITDCTFLELLPAKESIYVRNDKKCAPLIMYAYKHTFPWFWNEFNTCLRLIYANDLLLSDEGKREEGWVGIREVESKDVWEEREEGQDHCEKKVFLKRRKIWFLESLSFLICMGVWDTDRGRKGERELGVYEKKEKKICICKVTK